jgi:dolichol kinase
MEVQDHQPNLEGWRRDLVPFRKPAERSKDQRTLKEQLLIGIICFGLFVLTPAWIALCGWLCLCLAQWLIGA